MKHPVPSSLLTYIDADGRLSIEGLKLFERLMAVLRDHEDRLAANETTISSHTTTLADHETRITALEP